MFQPKFSSFWNQNTSIILSFLNTIHPFLFQIDNLRKEKKYDAIRYKSRHTKPEVNEESVK